jgi:hypothetical protein
MNQGKELQVPKYYKKLRKKINDQQLKKSWSHGFTDEFYLAFSKQEILMVTYIIFDFRWFLQFI